jgi:mono/diheme cytochrome c family protein
MSFSRKLILPFTLLASLALAACSLAEDITPPPNYKSPTPPPASAVNANYPLVPPDEQAGAAIYAQKCAPCHGQQGLGDGPQAAQLPNQPAAIGSADLARQAAPAEWFAIVSQGNLNQFMPGFSASLDDQQIWDVLAYVYSLSRPTALIQQGAQIYQQQCAGCHGPQGKGDGPQAKSLANPPARLADQSVMAQLSDQQLFQTVSDGVSPDMPAYSDKLSADQRWAVVSYVRSFTFPPSGGQLALANATPQPTGLQSTSPAAGMTATATGAAGGGAPTNGAENGTPQAASSVTPTAGIGSVKGKITNGSGGSLPTGLQATLQGYDNMQVAFSQSAPVAADGSFEFDNVAMPAGRVFVVTVIYKDATFSSDVGHPPAGGADLDLPVTIYEPTTDASALSVDRLHVFLDFSKPGILQVVELYIISNPTNKMVVASKPGQPVLTFDLPQGASNLQFQDSTIGQRYVATQNGFGDTEPVQPGDNQHQVLFAFDLLYDKKLDVNLPLTLPVSNVVVFLEDSGVRLASSQLQDAGNQSVQGMSFHMYTGSDLAAGSALALTLSGKPSGSAGGAAGSPSTNLLIGLAIFAVALIVAGTWLYLARRPKLAAAAAGEGLSKGEEGGETAEALMDAIAALDDLYRAGKLPEEAYRERRAELKAQLVAIYNRQSEK